MNIKSEIKVLTKDISALSDEDKLKAQNALNLDLVLLFVENIGSAEKEIYKLLSDLSDVPAEEIADQSPTKTINMIQSIFEDEELGDFLNTALK